MTHVKLRGPAVLACLLATVAFGWFLSSGTGAAEALMVDGTYLDADNVPARIAYLGAGERPLAYCQHENGLDFVDRALAPVEQAPSSVVDGGACSADSNGTCSSQAGECSTPDACSNDQAHCSTNGNGGTCSASGDGGQCSSGGETKTCSNNGTTGGNCTTGPSSGAGSQCSSTGEFCSSTNSSESTCTSDDPLGFCSSSSPAGECSVIQGSTSTCTTSNGMGECSVLSGGKCSVKNPVSGKWSDPVGGLCKGTQ